MGKHLFFLHSSFDQRMHFNQTVVFYIWGLQPHTVMSAKKRMVIPQEMIGTRADMQNLDSIEKSALTAAVLIFCKTTEQSKVGHFHVSCVPSLTSLFHWFHLNTPTTTVYSTSHKSKLRLLVINNGLWLMTEKVKKFHMYVKLKCFFFWMWVIIKHTHTPHTLHTKLLVDSSRV